jgi:hypothetical protein
MTPEGDHTIITAVSAAHRRTIEEISQLPLWDLKDLRHPRSHGVVVLQPACDKTSTNEGIPRFR